jgi:hypothetical protein
MKRPYRTPLSLLLGVAIECVFATEAPAQMPTPFQGKTTLETSASGPSSSQLSRQDGLVLLHGSNNDGRTCFGPVVDRFTDRRTEINVDFAGCGASTIPEAACRWSSWSNRPSP